MSNHVWLVYVIGTALCWGAYGPSIHQGQAGLGSSTAAWRAILLVGVAYFVIAVLVPTIILKVQGQPFGFFGETTTRGTWWALGAGSLGAIGALFIVLAMKSGGQPIYVMPLVFGLAPVINVMVASALHKPHSAPHPWFYVGLALIGGGAGLVLYFKPS